MFSLKYLLLYLSLLLSVLCQDGAQDNKNNENSATQITDQPSSSVTNELATSASSSSSTKANTVTKSPAQTSNAPIAGDCRAPTIYNACMERAQLYLSQCSSSDDACRCKFTRERTLCFEQCKSADPGLKTQLETDLNSVCSGLNESIRNSILKPSSSSSSSSTSASPKTSADNFKNASKKTNGKVEEESSVAIIVPLTFIFNLFYFVIC